jgi:hypothetical protein
MRAPRVRIPQDEPVEFKVDGCRVQALLQKLSTTGGLACLRSSVRSGCLAEIAIITRLGPIHGLVEIFAPASQRSSSQAFRFVALSDKDQQKLAAIISLMCKQGLADSGSQEHF